MTTNSRHTLLENESPETDDRRAFNASSNTFDADSFSTDENGAYAYKTGSKPSHTLRLPANTLRQMSNVGMTEDVVRSLGVAAFEAEPTHALKRGQTASRLAALNQIEIGTADERRRLLETCAKTDRWAAGRVTGFSPAFLRSPAAIFLGLRISLLAVVMLASLQNGLFFLETSGFELSRGKIDALAISAIFSLGPAILSKWMLSGLSDLWRHRIEAVLKSLSLPVAVIGLLVFAIVFGQAQEQVNLFADAQIGWRIPIWVLLGTSMALESLASIALVCSCVVDFQQFAPVCTVDGEQYSVATEKLRIANSSFAERAAQRAELETELHTQNAEKGLFVERCVALFRAYALQLQLDKQSQEARLACEAVAMKQKYLSENSGLPESI